MRSPVPLQTVIAGLDAEGLIAASASPEAEALAARLRAVQPWYVRAMFGAGAWLASLLLIGFVGGFGLAMGGSAFVGAVLIAAAVWLRRRPGVGGNDFVVQSTLATSLAGQALFDWGVADLMRGEEIKTGCFVVMAVSGGLFFIMPDRIHRVLMVVLCATALMTLTYAFELNGLVPLPGPLLAALLVLVHGNRVALTAAGHGTLVRPLANGLMLSAFGCLLLSTLYVLPDLQTDFVFYPRPWISTLLLGVLFLYTGNRAWSPLIAHGGSAAAPSVYAAMLLVVAAAWSAPGVLLALIAVILGAGAGDRGFIAAGIAFLAVFVAAYFYGIDVPMPTKALTLTGLGAAVLLARWLLLKALGDPGGTAAGAAT